MNKLTKKSKTSEPHPEFSDPLKKAFDEPVFDWDKAFQDFDFPKIEDIQWPDFEKIDWLRTEDIQWPDPDKIE